MKTSIFTIATVALSLALATENATANGPSMTNKSTNRSTWSKSSSNTHTHRPLPSTSRTSTPRTTTPRTTTPRYTTPRYTTPRTPTVVVVPQRPRVTPGVTVVSGTTGVAGSGVLTNNAHVGYNPITQRYSIAFDSPGVSGMGILIQAGYHVPVLSATNWTTAVSYLKSIGAPGW